MSDESLIPYGKDSGKTAQNLLAAAEALDLDPSVVRHQPDDGGFRVPDEVAEKAGFASDAVDEGDEPAAKKTTAKKAAKKTANKG